MKAFIRINSLAYPVIQLLFNLLKEWHFGDASTPVAPMPFIVKDFVGLTKAAEGALNLYYASSELPGGRLLTTIAFGKKDVATK